MHKVKLYTDGACSGNPGNGGWGAILLCDSKKLELNGGIPDTTNNRAELLAVINGLSCLRQPCEITVYSDSAYVVNAFNQNWIQDWQNKGWRTNGKKAVQNVDLWKQLLEVIKPHKVSFVKVLGHSDNEYNNRCDKLARAAINKK